MTSKTVRLNSRESAIIQSAISLDMHFYETQLETLMKIDPQLLTTDKRADRDMLITSYQTRIDTMKKIMEKV